MSILLRWSSINETLDYLNWDRKRCFACFMEARKTGDEQQYYNILLDLEGAIRFYELEMLDLMRECA